MVILPLCSHTLLALYGDKVVLVVISQMNLPVIKTHGRQQSTRVIFKEGGSVICLYDGRELSLSVDRGTVVRRFMVNEDTMVAQCIGFGY